jgi:hypothetical protein
MITEVKLKVPVMSNIYTSNDITVTKRPNPVAPTVNYKYKSTERVNKFKPEHQNRRSIGDTF